MTGSRKEQAPSRRAMLCRRALACVSAAAVIAGPCQAAPAAAAVAQERAVAFVASVAGDVRRGHGAHAAPLAVLEELAPGTALTLEHNARVEIVLGGAPVQVLAIAGPCTLRMQAPPALPEMPGTACPIALRALAPQWSGVHIAPGLLGRASITLRGEGDGALRLRAPLHTQRSCALTQLRWDAPYGGERLAWTYAVRLVDPEGHLVFAATTLERRLDVRQRVAWSRGAPYLWTVTARAPDGRRAQAAAEFTVIDAAREEFLGLLEQSVAAPCGSAAFAPGNRAERILFALALEDAQLREEASGAWRALRPGT